MKGHPSMATQLSWAQRVRKAGEYIRRGDLSGLHGETTAFLAWKGIIRSAPQSANGSSVTLTRSGLDRTRAEADYWGQADIDCMRHVSWCNFQCFEPMCLLEMTGGKTSDIDRLIADTMRTVQREGLRGLVLGCGDMAKEHPTFINPYLSFSEIDAYDINEQAFAQARSVTQKAGLKVNLKVGDVNQLVLPANTYHLVVVFHSYHHFRRVGWIARQINQSLVPGGVFYLVDYTGPPRLQHSRRQLAYAQLLLEALPASRRQDIHGAIRQVVESVEPRMLSPDEAIMSHKILPALRENLCVVWQYNWGGLLYPLLEGISFNFDENEPADRALIDYFFALDHVLCRSGQVEPDFTITLATKKPAA
jgi:ubiquinone/menaquinone biosynthesis C-methylase UbiE